MFRRKIKITEKEQLYLDIIENMVKRKDCVIEINPSSMDYLLSIESEQYYVSIDSVGIQISNHDFLIIRRFEDYVINSAKNLVKEEATKRREAKKLEIFNNETALLTKISCAIKN